MKRKLKTVYILLISIVIYFALVYIYNNFIQSQKVHNIYVLNKSVKRGEILTEDMLESIKTSSVQDNIYFSDISSILKSQNSLVIDNEYNKGQIVYKSMLVDRQDYLKADNNMQIISIKVNASQDFVSYQIEKGSIVSIYYTGKISQAMEILNSTNKPLIMSKSITDGYASINIFEEIKILNVYDKYGNEILRSDTKNESTMIDTVTIQIDKNAANMLNNLKKYGDFSFTIKK